MAKAIQQHNSEILEQAEKGDIIKFSRGAYDHYGVYVGNKKVVHVTGNVAGASGPEHIGTLSGARYNKTKIEKEDFLKVANNTKAEIANKDDKRSPLSKSRAASNALSRVGEDFHYNIATNNCEHFANGCRYEEETSDQVNDVAKVTAGAVSLGFGVVSGLAGSLLRGACSALEVMLMGGVLLARSIPSQVELLGTEHVQCTLRSDGSIHVSPRIRHLGERRSLNDLILKVKGPT